MNTLKNQVNLVGNLGTDPQVKTFANGNTLTKLSIATNESRKNADGEYFNTTQWHNIIAWGKLGETMQQFLKKGSQVAIQGKLTYGSFQDKEGINRNRTTIVANEFLMLDKLEEN